jgi:hypothetical protein
MNDTRDKIFDPEPMIQLRYKSRSFTAPSNGIVFQECAGDTTMVLIPNFPAFLSPTKERLDDFKREVIHATADGRAIDLVDWILA